MNTIYLENSNIFFLSSILLCFESFSTKSHSRKQFVKTKQYSLFTRPLIFCS